MSYKDINKRRIHSHKWYIQNKQHHLDNMKIYYNTNKPHILQQRKLEYNKFKANRDLKR